MKQWIYILSIVFFVACNKVVEKPPVVIQAQSLKPAVTIDPLILQENKSHIDSLFKYAKENEITIFVKQKGKDSLIEVAAKHLPADIEVSYNIFRDNMGHIIRISESPTSESGDWFVSCNHYFDEKGKTFAFEKKTNSFDSGCTEGVLYETKAEYFDEKFAKLDHTYKLVDEDERHIAKDSCNIFEYTYKVQPDVLTYINNKAIPIKY